MRLLAITNIYPSAPAPGVGVFIEQQIQGLRTLGIEARVLFIDRRLEGSLSYYKVGEKMAAELTEFEPDVIHVMYGGVMADQVTRHCGKTPVVVTFHGSDLLGENCSGIIRKLVSRYGVFCSRKAARRATRVIVVARHLLPVLGAGVDREKISVIPCGIDLKRFKPLDQNACRQRLGWHTGIFHVVFASSAGDPVKRPRLARAAIEELERHNVRTEFHMMSGIANSEVPVWLNAANALLLTSRHEGSPTIVKEALACGLPVVSVNVGDVAERIEGIEGCYLAEAQAEDLAAQLKKVWERPERVEGRERLKDLSIEAVAGRLQHLYGQLCPGHPSEEPAAIELEPCQAFRG